MKISYCLGLSFLVAGCSSIPERELKDADSAIVTCTSAPNCVSSKATSKDRQVAPISFKGTVAEFQKSIQKSILSLPRTEIIKSQGAYMHAEFKTLIMRFTDDIELFFVPAESLIHVRSSSRTGYYDFGVNRNRVEKLRQLMTDTSPQIK